MALLTYQSLWATELRRPGTPEAPLAERFDRVKAAGYDGMCIDLGALSLEEARATVPEYRRTGLGGLLTAFPGSVEDLRPALRLGREIGSPYVIVVGQVMPITVAGMIPVIRDWLRVSAEEGMPIQFETHRNCITNDLFATLQLLDAVPEMRLSADLSHYVVDRELTFPIPPEAMGWMSRVLARSDSFQGRVATRSQVQVPIAFPQFRRWVDLFEGWWEEGFRGFRARTDADCIFLCELGPPEYAMTDANGDELSDRWEEALKLRRIANAAWERAAP
ncbi:sugar phosphate isomerase/epimerase [Oceanicella sp. SM1341]|uniref:sugar phosphate isomerase/epimerase family protein n=1 Tax=Oceanicella sp. SM1341 TaxID=1548889 RepID=UPI000E510457|nr:sugar phosphate isomerase/epimerase [Oceanicella sp. SM1341]